MTDCGELKHYLNVRITRTGEYIAMDQTAFCDSILEKFASWMGPATKTRKYPLPGDASDRLYQGRDEDLCEEQREYVENFPYKQIVGAVLYLAMHTRPDIAYAVGVLARHASNPTYQSCQLAVHFYYNNICEERPHWELDLPVCHLIFMHLVMQTGRVIN